MNVSQLEPNKSTRPACILILAAWIVILCVSDLPKLLWESFLSDPASFLDFKLILLAIFLILNLAFKPLRPLWQFAFVYLVFQFADAGEVWVRGTAFWQSRFDYEGVSLTAGYLSIHILDVICALLVILAMWLVKRDRRDFFLTKGQLDAPIEPVHWLGIKQGESWRVFGWIFTVCIAVGILIPLGYSVPLSTEAFARALPLLPVAILLAGLNAFAEETYFRASLLSTFPNVIGKDQTLLLSCILFGMAHFFGGSPPGVIGAALTGFLAFLLGKSMLETKGMLWAWIMHFVPDAFIFFSYAKTWN